MNFLRVELLVIVRVNLYPSLLSLMVGLEWIKKQEWEIYKESSILLVLREFTGDKGSTKDLNSKSWIIWFRKRQLREPEKLVPCLRWFLWSLLQPDVWQGLHVSGGPRDTWTRLQMQVHVPGCGGASLCF